MKILKYALTAAVLLLIAAYAATMLGWTNWRPADESQASTGEGAKPQVTAAEATPAKPMPPCVEAKAGGPEDHVRTLYSQYPFSGKTSVAGEPVEVLGKYFDEKLVGMLAENQECQKSSHDLCAIDWNVLYAAQDGEISELKVCEMDAATHTVKAQFRNSGAPQVVTYQLGDAGKISDIRVAATDGEWSLAGSLDSYFGELTKGWQKAQQPEEAEPGEQKSAQCDKPKAGGPEDVVRTLYEQYPWKGDKVAINEPKAVLAKYFDDKLAGVIIKNQEAQAKKNGELQQMPNLVINYDMGYSQEIRGFRICAMDAAAKTVKVRFTDDHQPVVVGYQMNNTGAGWRISDVQYVKMQGSAEADQPYDWSMTQAFSN